MNLTPPSFPLRPINGGRLDLAPPKPDGPAWAYEPKLNGWRAWVHCPTGAMFNRENQRLTIGHEFSEVLATLRGSPREWLDVEALSRRVPIGKGSLILLDLPIAGTYAERQQILYDEFIAPRLADAWGFEQFAPASNALLSFAYHYEDGPAPEMRPRAAWHRLQAVNKQLKCELFEGLVAKRVDSAYPLQLRSHKTEFPFWMKHRWAF